MLHTCIRPADPAKETNEQTRTSAATITTQSTVLTNSRNLFYQVAKYQRSGTLTDKCWGWRVCGGLGTCPHSPLYSSPELLKNVQPKGLRDSTIDHWKSISPEPERSTGVTTPALHPINLSPTHGITYGPLNLMGNRAKMQSQD